MMDGSSFPEKLHVFVELQESALVLELRRELAEVQAKLKATEEARRRIERRYGQETMVNCELIDLCRRHGIRYRPQLDLSTWD